MTFKLLKKLQTISNSKAGKIAKIKIPKMLQHKESAF